MKTQRRRDASGHGFQRKADVCFKEQVDNAKIQEYRSGLSDRLALNCFPATDENWADVPLGTETSVYGLFDFDLV